MSVPSQIMKRAEKLLLQNQVRVSHKSGFEERDHLWNEGFSVEWRGSRKYTRGTVIERHKVKITFAYSEGVPMCEVFDLRFGNTVCRMSV